VDPEKTLTPQYDGRATAVSSSSWRMLETIGVSDRLEGQGCPIRSIRVSDGLEPGALQFDPPEGDDPLGIMFENRLLRAAMRDTAAECTNVNLVMPANAAEVVRDSHGVRVALDDSRLLAAPLLIGAEGRKLADSREREYRCGALALRPCRDRRDGRA
jgi:2-octaprenyl-6-methoxyphenol hydroxylase